MDNADPRSSAVESDTSATPPAVPPASRSWAQSFRRSRWIVIVFVVVVVMSFSTTNTPFSINGKKALYSHNLPSGK